MFKLLAFLSVIYHCHAYSSGAPDSVCTNMTPNHPFTPQTSQMPYKITLSKDQIKAGGTVEIGVTGGTFKGMLMEVRNGDKAVGEFIVPADNRYFKTLTCHGAKNSAVTHKNSNDKKNKKLVWKAPEAKGKYTVYVTVAKDGEVYWAAKPTEIISVF